MNRLLFTSLILTFSILAIFSAKKSDATIIFSWDGESGYQYMGSENAHPGGGYFQQMGGNVSASEGTYNSSSCTPDTNSHHYSVISNDPAAQGSTTGSKYSLKTPYLGVCPNEAFQRDTTVITTPLLTEYYVKWDQKWTGNFQKSVQQKFAKFYNSADTQEKTITAYLTLRANNASGTTPGATTGLAENFMPNIEGHFNKSGCTLYNGNIWVTPVPIAYGNCYDGQNRSFDDSDETNTPMIFELNRWYTIEIHSKLNTDINTSDAVYEIWIDGILRFSAKGFKFRDGGVYNTPGTNRFEFQHVYYNRSSSDQTTYMDNIVISDKPISVKRVSAPNNLNAKTIITP